MTHTHALFADQSQSIPDNLVALFGRIRAWNSSVARARERIVTAGLRHAEAIVADASVHPFAPDSFELAFSRFGVISLAIQWPPLRTCGAR